jgi:hypothetical protein
MKKVFFLTNKAGDSVFGALTEKHGQLPAFFTDSDAASRFFAEKIPSDQQDQHVFGGTESADDIRHFLNFNEKSYVLLDQVPMTGVEMFKKLSDN